MDAASEPLAPPRLVLRVGALGDRTFGREHGIDEEPQALEQAARAACGDVMREIATAVVGVFVDDMGQVLPPLDEPRRFWWESRLGLLLGRADVWRRRAGAGKPAPAFRDESPLVTVLAGREPGGAAFVSRAALAMNPSTPPPADSSERFVAFESVAVIVEDPDAAASARPVEDPRTLSVGTIPAQVPEGSAARSRDEAHERADAERRRALGFRAQAEALRHHADLLVAVWDPDAQRDACGTGESVGAALADGVPVVAIRLADSASATVHVLKTAADLARPPDAPWRDDLRECVKALLNFPDAPPANSAQGRRHGSHHPRAVFRAFLDGTPFAAPWPARCWIPLSEWMERERSFGSAILGFVGLGGARAGGAAAGAPPPAPPGKSNAPPAPATATYARVGRRAVAVAAAFGNAHRGGLLAAYLLGALVVVLALGGLLPHAPGWTLIAGLIAVLQLGALLVLGALWRTSTAEGWHAVHRETRFLAEALGCMEHLVPHGVHVPLRTEGARRTWSHWYYRALVRESPLRRPVIPRVPLDQQRDRLVTEWIGDPASRTPNPASRLAWHRRTHAAFERFAQGVDHLTFLALVTAIGALLFHLLVLVLNGPEFLSTLCVLTCLGFAAVLAATWGLRSQIDAVRIHERSQAMLTALAERARSLERLDLSDADAADARWPLAVEAAATARVIVEGTAG